MKKQFKTMNDLNKEYDKGPQLVDGIFVCPVCSSVHKTKAAAEKHINKRDCYSLLDMFKNTMYETAGYGIYKQMMTEFYQKTATIQGYRKAKVYDSIIRFVLFTNIHTVADVRELYLNWLYNQSKTKHINKIMADGCKESNLNSFRVFLQQYSETLIDSKKFYQMYRQELVDDDEFFIRSLEKAKIGIKFILEQNDFDFEKKMKSMAVGHQIRFAEFAEKVRG